MLIGKTNMPPMANGGMQRGVYGRAESPSNRDYLAAAYVGPRTVRGVDCGERRCLGWGRDGVVRA